jgi:hypothetical protein
MKFRPGRLESDPATIAAAPAHVFTPAAAYSVALTLDRSATPFAPQLYDNDTLPDCTAVALANYARGVAELNGFSLAVEAAKVPAFYGASIGNPPDLAATPGAQMIDVLRYQGRAGFDLGPQSLVGRFASVALTRRVLAAGINRMGGLYWGVVLRERDMDTVGVTDWDVRGRDDGAIIGRHAISAWDYAGLGMADTVRLTTYGGFQRATWSWVADRLEEAWGLIWRQLARADGTFWHGLTADDLAIGLPP